MTRSFHETICILSYLNPDEYDIAVEVLTAFGEAEKIPKINRYLTPFEPHGVLETYHRIKPINANPVLYNRISYHNGKLHGEYKEWHSNGRLCIHAHYCIHRKLYGECKEWHPNGTLVVHTHYIHGKFHGEHKEWHPNGTLWMHAHYIHGKMHGECKYWHPNGTLVMHTHYIHGKKHGEHKEWHLNGTLWMHAHYIHGEKHGECKNYSCDGEVTYTYHNQRKRRRSTCSEVVYLF